MTSTDSSPSSNSDLLVKCVLDLDEANDSVVTYWPGCAAPSGVTFTMTKTKDKDKDEYIHTMSGRDSNTKLKYSGNDSMSQNSKYFIGIRDGNQMRIINARVFSVMPTIDVNDKELFPELDMSAHAPLTIKEQMDEIKEKFGSRRTKKTLADKRKYAISFGEKDVDDIDGVNVSGSQETSIKQEQTSVQTPSSSSSDVDVLPPQNKAATSVNQVYKMEDIIHENEIKFIRDNLDEFVKSIEKDYVKKLITDKKDENKKIMAVYIELLMQLLELKYNDLRKNDPWAALTHDQLKSFMLEKYTCYQKPVNGRGAKYVITDREKDRMLISCIILSLMINNYRPLEYEAVQHAFKVPFKQVKKITEVIGCYLENGNNRAGEYVKCIVFKLPLYVIQDNKKLKRRRN